MTDDPRRGEILDDEMPDPEARDVTPGWVGRNRGAIEQGRALARALMLAAPPPARVALAAASVAADALLLADDMRRRGEDHRIGSMRAGAVALEGVAVLAVSRFAPARLAANLGVIEAARQTLQRAIAKEAHP